jgi:hypothetical protein
MANDTDVSSTQWVAIIALFLVLLVPIAVALSWWLKQRYARAVVLLQASVAGTSAAPVAAGQVASAAPSAVPAPGAPPLVIQVVPAASTKAAGDDPTAPARRLRRRVLWTQFTLGLVYWFSLLLTAAIGLAYYSAMMQEPETTGGSSFASTMMFLPVLFVPPLLAWSLQAGTRQSVAWWIVVAGSISVAIGLALQEHSIVAAFAAPAVLSALGLMLTAFLRPSVRGAGPPLVAAMIVGFLVFAAFSMVAVALDDGSPSDDWGSWGEILAAIGLLLAVTALSAWVGWRMLLRISRRYTKKRFSELQLALGSYWGLMTLIILASVMMLAFEDKTGAAMEWVGLLVVLLWLAWRVAQRLALRWAVRRAAPARSPLLLLRVFKPSGRSEAFMDRFLARWRFAAPVWMIAGPDLAGALMEPDEFFAYLRRNLADRFISDAGQIPERLAGLDGERDPDGRFRVSELFCANSTWQPVVLAMIERAGVILLDLREYTAGRAGTRYELLELLRRAPLERVIFLSDEAGDAPQLRSIIEEAWQVVGRRSGQTVSIVQLRSESDAELEGVFRMAALADGPDSMITRRSTP